MVFHVLEKCFPGCSGATNGSISINSIFTRKYDIILLKKLFYGSAINWNTNFQTKIRSASNL